MQISLAKIAHIVLDMWWLSDYLWMPNESSSSFNGEANFGGSLKKGLGVASISASAEAGGTMTRNSLFRSYKAYFTQNKIIPDLKPFTIADVKNKIQSLE